MTLDPQARAYLDKLASLKLPEFHTMPPAEARRLFKAMRGLAGRPDPVASVEDRRTPGGNALRVYRPIGCGPEPLPVLVYFHGGGWVLGDIETVDNLCRRISNASGCSVVSVDYGLSPELKYPGPLEDCAEAVIWVAQDSDSFRINPDKIAVGGDSAGANLAAGLTLYSVEYQRMPPLAFQLLIYPITDQSFDNPSYHENAVGYGLSREMMIWYWQQYLVKPEDGDLPTASPLRATLTELANVPPALVITAGYDVLRDEGQAYAARLQEAGVDVELEHFPGMIHGFLQMADSFDEGKRAIALAGQAVRKALLG